MSFLKVRAYQCNVQGMVRPESTPTNIHLNIDLIGAIHGNQILLKGGEILHVGQSYYTRFELPSSTTIPEA